MVDRQRIHRAIGRESEGTTREQAERAIENFRTKAREQRLDLPTGRKLHRTFVEAANDYLRRIENHPKYGRNFARKRQHLERRLSPFFRGQRIDSLTDFSISAYVRQRKDHGAALATINRELATLSHFLNRCVDWGWCRTKPRVFKNPEPKKRVIVLSESDKRELMSAAVSDQDSSTWIFIGIGMGTAMRHSEILRMRWDQIDFSQRRIFIDRAKAGQREQPMPPQLSNLLHAEWQRRGEPTGYVFATKRADAKLPYRQSMATQFRRVVKRAKLDPSKVTPHILRHTAITELVVAGVDLPTIQQISGHKTLAMVLRYTHLSNAHVDKAVANLSNCISSAVTP
ncbi:tyrosine-type recombinase/integrase [Erythrobacter vulgaris]|uniref:Tyrosine-type recombinase/integrase n=1 Tax=Qipengyuania vulgaris TaxID=291985 RepID=A0A844XVC8_9SPHN|nr:site-specific integrase [Qipengyuania vulgaris]MXO48922.1 tyrosine-type recombinase/integrase [Qipengyuania vulgaris]